MDNFESIQTLAEVHVRDPEDRKLLYPEALGIDGDVVRTSDFLALARRFILAYQLINLMEENMKLNEEPLSILKKEG